MKYDGRYPVMVMPVVAVVEMKFCNSNLTGKKYFMQ
jgi:hypothetical protein